jgi:nucleoside-triphosphatase THEP1
MVCRGLKLVLWTGPKHSGKTSAARRLIDRAAAEGISTAGVLAPAIYECDCLLGFDVVDVATGARLPLARRAEQPDKGVGRFAFLAEGLRFGKAALDRALASRAHLVVVDEFGPLELQGKGWRHAVDQLLSTCGDTLLLVVREELIGDVKRLYAPQRLRVVAATEPDAIDQVLRTLR